MYELMWDVSGFGDKSIWPDSGPAFVYSMNLGYVHHDSCGKRGKTDKHTAARLPTATTSLAGRATPSRGPWTRAATSTATARLLASRPRRPRSTMLATSSNKPPSPSTAVSFSLSQMDSRCICANTMSSPQGSRPCPWARWPSRLDFSLLSAGPYWGILGADSETIASSLAELFGQNLPFEGGTRKEPFLLFSSFQMECPFLFSFPTSSLYLTSTHHKILLEHPMSPR